MLPARAPPAGWSGLVSLARRRAASNTARPEKVPPRPSVPWRKCPSRAQVAFEFVRRPLHDVLELFPTLGEFRHHHGIERLVVDLRPDVGPRREAHHGGLLVGA